MSALRIFAVPFRSSMLLYSMSAYVVGGFHGQVFLIFIFNFVVLSFSLSLLLITISHSQGGESIRVLNRFSIRLIDTTGIMTSFFFFPSITP